MKALTNPRWIQAKGILFLVLGLLSSVLLLLEQPALKVAILLAVSVWGFCRFYYFAFYVIQHYVEPGFRFSGLGAFAWHLVRRRPSAAVRNDGTARPIRVKQGGSTA